MVQTLRMARFGNDAGVLSQYDTMRGKILGSVSFNHRKQIDSYLQVSQHMYASFGPSLVSPAICPVIYPCCGSRSTFAVQRWKTKSISPEGVGGGGHLTRQK